VRLVPREVPRRVTNVRDDTIVTVLEAIVRNASLSCAGVQPLRSKRAEAGRLSIDGSTRNRRTDVRIRAERKKAPTRERAAPLGRCRSVWQSQLAVSRDWARVSGFFSPRKSPATSKGGWRFCFRQGPWQRPFRGVQLGIRQNSCPTIVPETIRISHSCGFC
jgi:hypothetical protein